MSCIFGMVFDAIFCDKRKIFFNLCSFYFNVMAKKDNYPTWTESAERLILYADIMGFKNRVLLTDHEELRKQLTEFKNTFNKQSKPFLKNDYLRFVQFSDSILIVTQGADEKMLNIIAKAGVKLMQISSELGFPVKGVIAKGKFTFDEENQLYFGQPLVDAYLLHEEIKYYGIAIHHSAEALAKAYEGKLFSNKPIYISKGKVMHYHLCWNMLGKLLEEKDNTEQCLKWLELIAETVSGEPRLYIDHTREIFENERETSGTD